jgi:hypothetical protein
MLFRCAINRGGKAEDSVAVFAPTGRIFSHAQSSVRGLHWKKPHAIQLPLQKSKGSLPGLRFIIIALCGGSAMTNGDIFILYAIWFVLALGMAVILFKKNT